MRCSTSESSAERNLYDRGPIRKDSKDSLAKIGRRIPERSIVLDVGCGVGVLRCWVTKAKQCVVDGIELNPRSAAIARDCYRDVWEIDVESNRLNDTLKSRRYHAIVCADILGHLRAPGELLRHLEQHLDLDGRLYISVPNIAHIGVILEILSGEFLYRDEGLLDRTHLRFFTRKSILRLLLENGYSAKVVDHNVVDVQKSEFSTHNTQYLSQGLLKEIQKSKDNIVYQFVIEAVLKEKAYLLQDAIVADPPPAGPRSIPTLYWRGRDEQYDEERSVSASVAIGNYRQRIRFNFPAGSAYELRLNIADQPGVVVLYSAQLFGRSQVLWSWDGSKGMLLLGKHESLGILPGNDVGKGAYLESSTHNGWFIVPVSPEEAAAGTALEVELSMPSLGDREITPNELRVEKWCDNSGRHITDASSASDLGHEIEIMRMSLSWRITRPLRAIADLVRRGRGKRS